ncbi:hypothetical protein SDC9_143183 [bioreactor metagenome]|uniref:Uncharacterized protein n=1 Tax=bioreactor metagenome TaxID=1076179 RepID=A0A645E2U9_9ZZZZ
MARRQGDAHRVVAILNGVIEQMQFALVILLSRILKCEEYTGCSDAGHACLSIHDTGADRSAGVIRPTRKYFYFLFKAEAVRQFRPQVSCRARRSDQFRKISSRDEEFFENSFGPFFLFHIQKQRAGCIRVIHMHGAGHPISQIIFRQQHMPYLVPDFRLVFLDP